MLNKKGAIEFSLKYTAEIILALAVFIVIILLVFFILSPSYGLASEWVCKTSVTLSSQTRGILGKLGMDTIMCYTDTIKSEAKTKDEALKDIAENMRKCWNMWGEGNLNPEGKNIWYGREVKCYTCYKISFPELEESVSTREIYDCLMDPKICTSNKLKGEEIYWNYFKMSNPANTVNIILKGKSEDENANIIEKDKDKAYAVAYFENIEINKMAHILGKAYFGAKTGTVVCFFVPGAQAYIPLCSAAGAGVGVTVDAAFLVGRFGWDKIRGAVPADGIQFMDYDVAAKNCATVVRVKEEVEFEDVIKNG